MPKIEFNGRAPVADTTYADPSIWHTQHVDIILPDGSKVEFETLAEESFQMITARYREQHDEWSDRIDEILLITRMIERGEPYTDEQHTLYIEYIHAHLDERFALAAAACVTDGWTAAKLRVLVRAMADESKVKFWESLAPLLIPIGIDTAKNC